MVEVLQSRVWRGSYVEIPSTPAIEVTLTFEEEETLL